MVYIIYIYIYIFFFSFPIKAKHNLIVCEQVGDFGLSRLKHETYLTTKTGKGTV